MVAEPIMSEPATSTPGQTGGETTAVQQAIFARIREALAVVPAASHRPAALAKSVAEVLPVVGVTFAEQVALFAGNARELRAEFKQVAGLPELVQELQRLAGEAGWRRLATHAGTLTDAVAPALGLPVLRVDGGVDAAELERCDVGLTECDALVAQTGSVLVTSRSAGGRALSVLPPHHVVLARADQLVAGLPDAFAMLEAKYAAGYPSMISFITGPSRTGDIERILVLGAHGPKRLTILMVGGGPD
jgi:L-lactate dehydrogenase complex protein LldG